MSCIKWRLQAKLQLNLTFCIYLVREILFLLRKSQGILKRDACCNHDSSTRLTSETNLD